MATSPDADANGREKEEPVRVQRRMEGRRVRRLGVACTPAEWQWAEGDAVALYAMLTAAMRERRVVTLRWTAAGAETVASGLVVRLVAGSVRLSLGARGEQIVPLTGVQWAHLEREWAWAD